MNVVLAPEAVQDLELAVDFLIGEGAIDAAIDLVDRTFELANRLARREFEGPEQVLASGRVVRSWPLPPFRLYYRWREDALGTAADTQHQGVRASDLGGCAEPAHAA